MIDIKVYEMLFNVNILSKVELLVMKRFHNQITMFWLSIAKQHAVITTSNQQGTLLKLKIKYVYLF